MDRTTWPPPSIQTRRYPRPSSSAATAATSPERASTPAGGGSASDRVVRTTVGLPGVRPVAEAPDRVVRPAAHQDRVDAGEKGVEAEVLSRVIRCQPVVDGPVRAGNFAVQGDGDVAVPDRPTHKTALRRAPLREDPGADHDGVLPCRVMG
jgi:hypothetical protein